MRGRDELLRITLLSAAWLRGEARPDIESVQSAPIAPASRDAHAAPQEKALAAPVSREAREAREARAAALDALRASLQGCQRCAIARDRHNLVFGQGDPCARLMIIGEGPGKEEDLQGIAFCGPSGELLTKMLAAIGLAREEVYIANIIKCRPPRNRDPLPEEVLNCRGWLDRQIGIIQPALICTAGNVATKTLLDTDTGIMRLHGALQSYRGIPVVPTFHPSFLLRDPRHKKDAWKDLQYIQSLLAKSNPGDP